MRKMGKIKLEEMTWMEAEKALREARVVIIPLGAIEAHGPHLPLATDNYIVEKIAEEVAKRVNGLLLPLIPYGQVWSLSNFPGSLNVSDEHLFNFLVDICLSLHKHGVNNIAFISFHIGNGTVIKKAARYLKDNYGINVFYFVSSGLSKVRELCESKQWHKSYFHAEEIETSIMLYIKPELVDMSKAEARYPDKKIFEYYPQKWDELTDIAVIGDPTVATREKGEKMLEIIIKEIVELLDKGLNFIKS